MTLITEGARVSRPPRTDPEPAEAEAAAGGSRANSEQSDFARLFERVSSAIDRGEALMNRAATAAYGGMDAGALIALQAGIYRYSEAVDLTAKLVDRATTATRTVLTGGH